MKSMDEIISGINALDINEGHFTVKDAHLTYEVTFDESVVDITVTDERDGSVKGYSMPRDGNTELTIKGYRYVIAGDTAELLMTMDARQLEGLKRMVALIRDHATKMEDVIRDGNEELEVEVTGVVPPFTVELVFDDPGKVQVYQDEWHFHWDELGLGDVELHFAHPFPHVMVNDDKPFNIDICWEHRVALINALEYYRKHIDRDIPYSGWLQINLSHIKLIIYPNGNVALADREGMTDPMEIEELTEQLGSPCENKGR